MQVLIDLRPQHLVREQAAQFSPLRIASAVLFGVFVLISAANILFALFSLDTAKAGLASIENEKVNLEQESRKLSGHLEQSRAFVDRARSLVDFAGADLPTVEFLSALEGVIPEGMWIENLSMKDGVVGMNGIALSHDDVILFCEGLNRLEDIVASVETPVASIKSKDNLIINNFSVSCRVKTLGVVAADGRQAKSANESER